MFLSKKNAHYYNRPKNDQKPKRVLGGWADDQKDQEEHYDYTIKPSYQQTPAKINLLEGQDIEGMVDLAGKHKDKGDKGQSKTYYNWDELNDKNDIECEKKLVEEIVQPIGIRIKPSQSLLTQFYKESKGMGVHIVGSLLLSKLEVNYKFQVKAKALHTIQYLIKKNAKYVQYFKAHQAKLREFPEPEDNVDNYKKILKTVLNALGATLSSQNQQPEESKFNFVDPGYNQQKNTQGLLPSHANKPKKQENKRKIIGPGQNKLIEDTEHSQHKVEGQKKIKPKDFDILDLDLKGGDLLGEQPQAKHISFDELMKGSYKL